MADKTGSDATLALDTKVEKEFVAPLTALRANLEILRDFEDLDQEERQRFLETAILACTRLEKAVEELGTAVYSAGRQSDSQRTDSTPAPAPMPAGENRYDDRIKFLEDIDAIEIDFSDFEFSSSDIVNDFYDVVEERIKASGRKWYFLVNYRDCSIWPEAWVAFAHRGKKVNVLHSLGTARYVESEPSDDQAEADSFDPDMFTSREAALAALEEKAARQME